MKVFIYLNGAKSSPDFYRSDFIEKFINGDRVICANGGLNLAKSIGIIPDVVIGDMDSKKVSVPKGVDVIEYPPDKDFSDFELAVDFSKKFKPDKIIVYGALGGRKDHEIINLVILGYMEIPMIFIEKEVEIYNVKNELFIQNQRNKTCSLVSLSEGTIVKQLYGFKYGMFNEELKPSSRGLSNIIVKDKAKIELEGKAVLFFLNKEK